jgi:hypothetical protein
MARHRNWSLILICRLVPVSFELSGDYIRQPGPVKEKTEEF